MTRRSVTLPMMIAALTATPSLAPLLAASAPARTTLPAAAAAGEPRDLDAVMALLAQRRHGHVDFVEQHFIAMLKRPVESSGELRYDAPDRLEKRTLKPREDDLLLAGGELTVERGHSKRVMDLHAYPQVLPLVESIRATLAGDLGALQRLFKVDFAGDPGRWTLTLLPLDPKVKQTVAQVRIEGLRDQLLKVEIRQPDGDRSLMTLRPSAAP